MIKIMEELREKLAELEHEQWRHWMEFMLDKRISMVSNTLKKSIDISFPEKTYDDWICKMHVNYNDFIEEEKISDRLWADKVLEIVKKSVSDMYFNIGTPEFDRVMSDWHFKEERKADQYINGEKTIKMDKKETILRGKVRVIGQRMFDAWKVHMMKNIETKCYKSIPQRNKDLDEILSSMWVNDVVNLLKMEKK